MTDEPQSLVITLTAKDDEPTLRKLTEFVHVRSMRGNVLARIAHRAIAKYIMRLVFEVQSKGVVSSK